MGEQSTTYKQAGVDIDAGEQFVEMIKQRVRAAWPDAAQGIGGFAGGGLIPKNSTSVVSSTDGTGTKAILSAMVERFRGIGQDAVAMGAVDTYVSGSRPAFLLDSLDVARLNPDTHITIIESVIKGCQSAGCRLIGGETAELPGMFKNPWMFNLNVTSIGFPDPDLEFAWVRPGQLVYGWPSGGLCSNGYSLARKVFGLDQGISKARQQLEKHWPGLSCGITLAEALLEPTPIWIQSVERQRQRGVKFAGHAHITGGGMVGNIPRILPCDCKVAINQAVGPGRQSFP